MPTGIGYVDETWNCILGCSPCSPGCEGGTGKVGCYAAIMHRRLHAMGAPGYELPFDQVRVNWAAMDKPLHWRKPRRILTCSMSDWCHEQVDCTAHEIIMGRMLGCSQHAFLTLTKRPARVPGITSGTNIWRGFTAENQEWLDRRIGEAWWLTTAPRVWLSAEPLLGPLDLSGWFAATQGATGRYVVVGPETGPGKRPCSADWVLGVARQCQASDVPYYVKGLGGDDEALMGRLLRQDLVPLPEGTMVRRDAAAPEEASTDAQ